MDHVIGHLTTNGVTQQWLESQGSRLIQEREVQVRQLEQVQSADLAASMTELAQLQTTYQATMQMINSTNSMSILNYL
jgi:flagellin-like hook-associated protein FlgL